MSVAVGSYEFQGPYNGVTEVEDRAGVYAVVNCVGDEVLLLEVSHGSQMRQRLEDHPRLAAWRRYFSDTLGVLVHYTPQSSDSERKSIVKNIHAEFGPFLNLDSEDRLQMSN